MSIPANLDLTGIRIWLSASVPDDASAEEKERLLKFVRLLATEVFKHRGHVVHGSHPSIVPTLLEEAVNRRTQAQRKAELTLVVSRFYSKNPGANGIDWDLWKNLADVVETAEGCDKAESMARLRDRLAAQADVLVAVGGRWWNTAPLDAGVGGGDAVGDAVRHRVFRPGWAGWRGAGLFERAPRVSAPA